MANMVSNIDRIQWCMMIGFAALVLRSIFNLADGDLIVEADISVMVLAVGQHILTPHFGADKHICTLVEQGARRNLLSLHLTGPEELGGIFFFRRGRGILSEGCEPYETAMSGVVMTLLARSLTKEGLVRAAWLGVIGGGVDRGEEKVKWQSAGPANRLRVAIRWMVADERVNDLLPGRAVACAVLLYWPGRGV